MVSGTEPDPNKPIYGYNPDQSLDITGGVAKSYNSIFTDFSIRYHGDNFSNLKYLLPQYIEAQYRRALSYFIQRGFNIPFKDVYQQYQGQYICNRQGFSTDPYPPLPATPEYVGIKFVYENSNPIPVALDLVTTASPKLVLIGLYEADVTNYQNGYFYPLRIPITTDFCNVYSVKYGKEPIAYYSELYRTITISVAYEDNVSPHFSAFEKMFLPQYQIDVDWRDYLLEFQGTFALMKRDIQNNLVSASFPNAAYLIQSSQFVHVKSQNVDHGIPTVNTVDMSFYNPGGQYNGYVLSLMNGGSTSYDIYCYNIGPTFNALENEEDPINLPTYIPGGFSSGDDPYTVLKENYSAPSYNAFFEGTQQQALSNVVQYPTNILLGQTYPEDNPAIPPPVVPADDLIRQRTSIHEFVHACQQAAGQTYIFIPGEALAVGIESDIKAVGNLFNGPFRSRLWTRRLVQITRATFSLLQTDNAINNPAFSYGNGIFWKYLATTIDPNQQSIRRMCDILSTDTQYGIGPLMKANNFPYSKNYGTLTSPNGCSLALNKALGELFGANIKDVMANYAVSLALLRNNTSIPPQYRHIWPYWLYNTTYPFNIQISQYPGSAPFANWWGTFNSNGAIPANWNTGFTGETFIRTLPNNFTEKVRDLTMLLFQVPAGTNSITVNILSGEWRLSLVQFISNGGPSGTFNMDGQYSVTGPGVHVFNIGVPFVNNGTIRLVCAHVTLTDYGGLGNFYEPVPPNLTGEISIVRT